MAAFELPGASGQFMSVNFFDTDIQSPIPGLDNDMSGQGQSLTSAGNPFYMSNNPFPQSFIIKNGPPNSADPDSLFSSPLSGINPLVFTSGSSDLAREQSSIFPSYTSAMEQSPALTSVTFSVDGPSTPRAPTLLPAISMATEGNSRIAMSNGMSTFDNLSSSGRTQAVLQKANTRVEIPPDQTLCNIDKLIDAATNEEEIKRLKRHKRLLRNRQAALDSRVRKRRYTDSLEKEKEKLEKMNEELNDEVRSMREQLAQYHHKIAEVTHNFNISQRECETYSRQLQASKLEQEEMVRNHTLETARLRKQNQFLSDHLANGPTPPVSEPGSFATVLDGPGMVMSDYDDLMNYNSPLKMVPQSMSGDVWPAFQPASELSSAGITYPDSPSEGNPMFKQADKPEVAAQSSSSLLWILLLCGAFVATKSSGTSVPAIPQMPEEVRVASATVLDSMLQDSSIPTMTSSVSGANPSQMAMFVSSVNDVLVSNGKIPTISLQASGAENMGIKSESPLDILDNQYIRHSLAHEGEHLFSMTPDQYNSIHSTDSVRPFGQSQPPKRRSFTEALNAMHANRQDAGTDSSASLWNSISANVIQQFRLMLEKDDFASRNGGPVKGPSMIVT